MDYPCVVCKLKKMNDILENDRKFKEAIGAFIIAFSELEFGLAILCTLTEFDPRHKDIKTNFFQNTSVIPLSKKETL